MFRALRKEEDPYSSGLLPPADHDPDVSAIAHVSAGSKAKKKSPFVSLSRSKKVAAAWASNPGGSGRMARVRLPLKGRDPEKVVDLTDPSQAGKVFPALKGTGYNAAKASQEVLVKGGVGQDAVTDVYSVEKSKVGEYNQLKKQKAQGQASGVDSLFRTRAKLKETPAPRVVRRLPDPRGVPSSQQKVPSSSSISSSSSSSSISSSSSSSSSSSARNPAAAILSPSSSSGGPHGPASTTNKTKQQSVSSRPNNSENEQDDDDV